MSEQRRYTVAEVDALRRACRKKCIYGRYGGPWRTILSWGCDPQEVAVRTEEMVRTHMFAGHTAEDLLASEEPAESQEAKTTMSSLEDVGVKKTIEDPGRLVLRKREEGR